MSRGESLNFHVYYIFLLLLCSLFYEGENLKKRQGLESCTRRLIIESDQPSLLQICNLSLSVCVTHSYIDKGIRCSFRNLALTFRKKLYLLTVLACINGCSDGCAGSYFFGSNQPCSAHAVKLTSFSFGYPMYNIVVSDIYYFKMSWQRFFFIHPDYD